MSALTKPRVIDWYWFIFSSTISTACTNFLSRLGFHLQIETDDHFDTIQAGLIGRQVRTGVETSRARVDFTDRQDNSEGRGKAPEGRSGWPRSGDDLLPPSLLSRRGRIEGSFCRSWADHRHGTGGLHAQGREIVLCHTIRTEWYGNDAIHSPHYYFSSIIYNVVIYGGRLASWSESRLLTRVKQGK